MISYSSLPVILLSFFYSYTSFYYAFTPNSKKNNQSEYKWFFVPTTGCCRWRPFRYLYMAVRVYGGDDASKYQINKETTVGDTPLRVAYIAWYHGRDKRRHGLSLVATKWRVRQASQFRSDALFC